jgi:hypothetical protein
MAVFSVRDIVPAPAQPVVDDEEERLLEEAYNNPVQLTSTVDKETEGAVQGAAGGAVGGAKDSNIAFLNTCKKPELRRLANRYKLTWSGKGLVSALREALVTYSREGLLAGTPIAMKSDLHSDGGASAANAAPAPPASAPASAPTPSA